MDDDKRVDFKTERDIYLQVINTLQEGIEAQHRYLGILADLFKRALKHAEIPHKKFDIMETRVDEFLGLSKNIVNSVNDLIDACNGR